VNCEGEDGDRPLHLACLYGHLECVQVLLLLLLLLLLLILLGLFRTHIELLRGNGKNIESLRVQQIDGLHDLPLN
jgi:ankyrin repeat protein